VCTRDLDLDDLSTTAAATPLRCPYGVGARVSVLGTRR